MQRQRPARPTPVWPVTTVVLAGLIALLLVTGGEGPVTLVLPTVVAVAAAGVAAWAVRRSRQARADYDARLTEWAASEAVLSERMRIAGDLHDIVSHALGLITVRAAAARLTATLPDPAGGGPAGGAAGQSAAGDGTAGQDTARDGTAGQDTARDGTAGQDTARDGTAGQDTARDGTAGQDTARDGTARKDIPDDPIRGDADGSPARGDSLNALAGKKADDGTALEDPIGNPAGADTNGGGGSVARSDEALEALADIENASRAATAELRRMLTVLRSPDDAGPRTPLEGLDRLGAIIAEAGGAGVRARLKLDIAYDLTLGVQVAVCHTVREGLRNVARHAGPSDVEVDVYHDGDAVVTAVVDDGPEGSWNPVPGAGHGLVGLRERVAGLGGTLRAAPEGRGFRLEARIPDEAGE